MATSSESSASSVMPACQAIDGGLLRLLAEVGFVATASGLWGHAEAIFNGIRAVRPHSEFPVISQALARMTVGDDRRAIDLLKESALKINPKNPLARSFLGLALKRSGNVDEAKNILSSVILEHEDERAVEIAKIAMDESFQ